MTTPNDKQYVGLDVSQELTANARSRLIAVENELRRRFDRTHDCETGRRPTLDKRLGTARRFGFGQTVARAGGMTDVRQRAIVKVHYFGHGGGGASAVKAHVRYLARDGAAQEIDGRDDEHRGHNGELSNSDESGARSHAAYLAREQAFQSFYDAIDNRVDGAARAAVWAHEGKRHFRVILAAENAGPIEDLRAYTRSVMDDAEKALGTRLEWFAIDHFDTDNPHSHIVLRGRRGDGRPLLLPRAFVQNGLREIAREKATDRLGPRSRDDDRRALAKEARAHRPTRLDALIERPLTPEKALRVSALRAPDRDPHLTAALKTRARELQRLGLAREVGRNVLHFAGDWRDALKELEQHIDLRKPWLGKG